LFPTQVTENISYAEVEMWRAFYMLYSLFIDEKMNKHVYAMMKSGFRNVFALFEQREKHCF